MNLWLIGATVLLAGLVPCLVVALRASLLDALVASELAATVTALALVLLAEGYHRPSYFVLPILLAVLAFVGGLVFIRFLGERWL
jgi:multisubunit Na+/H+ antiporter MnhF subunit